MTLADLALHCEVRKVAYRQTKDGIVLSFLLHPNEVPEGLALAALGTRYQMAVVEIGDDEQPTTPLRPRSPQPHGASPTGDDSHSGQSHQEDGGTSSTKAPRAKHSWDELLPAQQAGILCDDRRFWKFLNDERRATIVDSDDAATWVRRHCGVNSRANITERFPDAMANWRTLVTDYRLWSQGAVA